MQRELKLHSAPRNGHISAKFVTEWGKRTYPWRQGQWSCGATHIGPAPEPVPSHASSAPAVTRQSLHASTSGIPTLRICYLSFQGSSWPLTNPYWSLRCSGSVQRSRQTDATVHNHRTVCRSTAKVTLGQVVTGC